MMRLFRSEVFRLRKRPQSWILIIIMVLGVAAFYSAMTVSTFVLSDPTGIKEDLGLSGVFTFGMNIVTFVGYILIVVLAAGLIGNEYGWNTIRPLLARSPSRNALLSAKWLTMFACSIVLFLIGFVATLMFSAAGSAIAGSFEMADAGDVGSWVVGFGRVLVSQIPYAVLAFAVALATRSNAAGIAVGIGFGMIEPLVWALLGLLSDAFDSIRKFGLEYPSTLLFNMNSGLTNASSGEAWRAVAVLTGWMVILITATYWLFNRRDVTSG